jgi:hypothetical protein
MKRSIHPLVSVTIVTVSATLALSGCAPAPTPGGSPDGNGSSSSQDPCIVGVWNLDVADYGAQSEEYVLGLGLPIEGFAMDGSGTIQFTADGLVSSGVDLTVTGTIVAGETAVPLNTRSAYSASGDWSTGSEASTVDLAHWSSVPDPDVVVDPDSPDLPTIDYTDIPSVQTTCTASTLVIQAPGTPLSARWTR